MAIEHIEYKPGTAWTREHAGENIEYLNEVIDSINDRVSPMDYKGSIANAAAFPTLATVDSGDMYTCTANVTDNDPTKTNTGQSFLAGDEIIWNGTNWTNIGTLRAHASSHATGAGDPLTDVPGTATIAGATTLQTVSDKVAMLTVAAAGTGAKIELAEPTGGGANKVIMQAPALTGDRTITFPDAGVDLGAINDKTAMLTVAAAGTGAKIELAEPTGGGANKVIMQAPALTGDRTITFPDADVTLGDIAANTLKTAMLTRETAGTGGKIELLEPTVGGASKVIMEAPALTGDRTVTFPDANVSLGQIETNRVNIVTATNMADMGIIGQAKLIFTNQAIATDTIAIGADTYEFDGVGLNINVAIGALPADTQANLITAINTLGTESVFADNDPVTATTVRIRNAATPGGTPTLGTQNLVLAEAITPVQDIWDQDNLNFTGRAAYSATTGGQLVAGVANLLTPVILDLPFAPTLLEYHVTDAAGLPIAACTATGAIVANQVVFDLAAGLAPMVGTDILHWKAYRIV